MTKRAAKFYYTFLARTIFQPRQLDNSFLWSLKHERYNTLRSSFSQKYKERTKCCKVARASLHFFKRLSKRRLNIGQPSEVSPVQAMSFSNHLNVKFTSGFTSMKILHTKWQQHHIRTIYSCNTEKTIKKCERSKEQRKLLHVKDRDENTSKNVLSGSEFYIFNKSWFKNV